MSKFKESIMSPHIKIALTTGASIIILAIVSKRILPEPIGYLPLAVPAFIALIFEGLLNRYKDKKICTTWYWVIAVLLSTAIVIVLHTV